MKKRKKINKKKKRKFTAKKKRKKINRKKLRTKKSLNLLKLKNKKKGFLHTIVKIQSSLSFDPRILSNIPKKIEKGIQNFFDGLENKVNEFKTLREIEKKRQIIEQLEIEEKERKEIEKRKKLEEQKSIELKKQAIKEEAKLQKERAKDIKNFLRKEQALIRKELAEKQKKFLQELQLEKQIEKFRVRELKELEKLEKISLAEKRENYKELQVRIDRLKEKYREIRDQKIRERVQALGISISENDDRESLLKKEKEFTLARQRIELNLESFYRSAASLVFQLNKRHITRQMSILRCIDRRFETGEIFIKWDESDDIDWLILIYIKNNSPNEGVVIEDKSNPEKNITKEFNFNEIFKASDFMVDSLTQLIDRTRKKDN